ncbi:hypothetical protein D3C72_1450630 [compost metagenome]
MGQAHALAVAVIGRAHDGVGQLGGAQVDVFQAGARAAVIPEVVIGDVHVLAVVVALADPGARFGEGARADLVGHHVHFAPRRVRLLPVLVLVDGKRHQGIDAEGGAVGCLEGFATEFQLAVGFALIAQAILGRGASQAETRFFAAFAAGA